MPRMAAVVEKVARREERRGARDQHVDRHGLELLDRYCTVRASTKEHESDPRHVLEKGDSWRTVDDEGWIEIELPQYSEVHRIEIEWWGTCAPKTWSMWAQYSPYHSRLELAFDHHAARSTGATIGAVATVVLPELHRFGCTRLRLVMSGGQTDPWFKRYRLGIARIQAWGSAVEPPSPDIPEVAPPEPPKYPRKIHKETGRPNYGMAFDMVHKPFSNGRVGNVWLDHVRHLAKTLGDNCDLVDAVRGKKSDAPWWALDKVGKKKMDTATRAAQVRGRQVQPPLVNYKPPNMVVGSPDGPGDQERAGQPSTAFPSWPRYTERPVNPLLRGDDASDGTSTARSGSEYFDGGAQRAPSQASSRPASAPSQRSQASARSQAAREVEMASPASSHSRSNGSAREPRPRPRSAAGVRTRPGSAVRVMTRRPASASRAMTAEEAFPTRGATDDKRAEYLRPSTAGESTRPPSSNIPADTASNLSVSARSDEAPSLPGGWSEYRTYDGDLYYYNEDLGSCAWERPQPEELPDGWARFRAEDGEKYYVDRQTGTSQWERPRSASTNAGSRPGSAAFSSRPVSASASRGTASRPVSAAASRPVSAPRTRPSSAGVASEQAEAVSEDPRETEDEGSEVDDMEGDPDLPPGWRRVERDGQMYFWHVPSDTTAWGITSTTESPE